MSEAAMIAPDAELIEDFKGAMRLLAASVSVITAGTGDQRRGLTATAVCSLSMTPPSMLVCVNRTGDAHAEITRSGSFCVNVLSSDDEAVARRFAGQDGAVGTDKFLNAEWLDLSTGSPALASALASIDCRVAEMSHTASHTVFFGTVQQVRLQPEKKPLLHFNRTFLTLPDAATHA